MNDVAYSGSSTTQLVDLGYDDGEARIVAQAAALIGPPLEPFARDLKSASIHVTGHQLMGVWQGCTSAKAQLCLSWPARDGERMVSGQVIFSGLSNRLSSRQAIAVAGVVAEWLIREEDSNPGEDEWDLFSRLRDGAWMSPDDLEMTDGTLTWHAVKRASKLLRRHWNIVNLSSASKRKDLLYRLLYNLPEARPETLPLGEQTMLRRRWTTSANGPNDLPSESQQGPQARRARILGAR